VAKEMEITVQPIFSTPLFAFMVPDHAAINQTLSRAILAREASTPATPDYEVVGWSSPHDLSMLRYWLGADPVALVARGQAYLKAGTEDVVFVTLNYPDRVLASIHVSWLDPVKTRRVTVVGDRKMVVFDDTHTTEKLRIYDHGADYQPRDGEFGNFIAAVRDGDIVIPRIEPTEPLREELAHFIECVTTGREPIASGEDGTAIVRVLEWAEHELLASRAETTPI